MNHTNNDILTDQLVNSLTNSLIPNLDPKKTQILLFYSKKNRNNFILKIDQQKFLGVPRLDFNNETYWRFHELTDYESGSSSPLKENERTNNSESSNNS